MITYQQETLVTFLPESKPLFDKYYAEVAELQIPQGFNAEFYRHLESRNRLKIYTIRDNGKLIGFSFWVLFYPPHYKTSLTATSDMIFVLQEYRKGLFGYKFLKHSLNEIKKHNPQRILVGVKPNNDFGKILERLGAGHFETVYSFKLE